MALSEVRWKGQESGDPAGLAFGILAALAVFSEPQFSSLWNWAKTIRNE